MMTVFSRNLLPGFALSAICAALVACGSGSNNLTDPVSNTGSSSTCGASNGLCVTGQLVDEPVTGINYECDTVANVTTAEGYFVCPNNSVVTFFLLSSDGKKKVTLGTAVIQPLIIAVPDPKTGKSKAEAQLLQLSPLDLVSGAGELDNLEGTDLATTKVLNILRVLQGVASTEEFQLPAPSKRIVVSSAARDKLNLLDKDFGAGGFSSTTTLDETFTKIGITLPAVADAKNHFLAGQRIMLAGLYEAPGLVFSVQRAIDDVIETGIVGKNGDTIILGTNNKQEDKAIESILLLLDRDGRSIGLGQEWKGITQSSPTDSSIPKNVTEMRSKIAPSELVPVSDGLGFSLNGKVKSGFKFKVINKDTLLDDGFVEIYEGTNRYGFISGHPFIYRSLFGLPETTPVSPDLLGKWRRLDKSGQTASYVGSVNLERRRRFDPLLDPAAWKTLDTVKSGEKAIFPLHFKLTFKDSDVSTSGGCSLTGGCTIGSAGITVLENGNIISDMDNNCSSVDANLVDKVSAQQEYRLGAVSAIFPLSGKYYISPVILFSRIPGWEKFYGIMIGDAGRKARIDVSGIQDGLISMKSFENDKTDSSKLSEAAAEWLNYPLSMASFQTTPVDKTGQFPKSYGIISDISLQSCYSPAIKP